MSSALDWGSPPLRFCVIGATKSETTTIFRLFPHHPAIYLPPDKEVPFFSEDDRYARGWGQFVSRYLGDVPEGRQVGKVTPQYMEDSRQVAPRMATTFPDLKLVAVLRNPVERAYSYWRMRRRQRAERRSFRQAMEDQMRPRELQRVRSLPRSRLDSSDLYVATGEYGRILADFLQHFTREQTLVLLTEILKERPEGFLDALLPFLGLTGGFRPPNLGKRYHVGGSREILPGLEPLARRSRLLRAAWRSLPLHLRRSILFWYRTEAVLHERGREDALDPETRKLLTSFYRDDVSELERRLGRRTPWPELTGAP